MMMMMMMMMMIIIIIIIILILPPRLLSHVHKVIMLNYCSIVRNFLSDEVHLPDEESDNL
jgi:hypothetical protein